MTNSSRVVEQVETEQLLKRSADGSPEAWDELLHRVSPFLRTILRGRVPGRLRGRIDTDEAFQEGFIELRKRSNQFDDQGPGSARRWMTTVIKNRLTDLIRYHSAIKRAPGAESVNADDYADRRFDPANLVENLDGVAQMLAGIERLPSLKRNLIALHFFQGWSFEQISAEMKIPVGTLRRWMKDALLAIKRPDQGEA